MSKPAGTALFPTMPSNLGSTKRMRAPLNEQPWGPYRPGIQGLAWVEAAD